VVNYCAVSLGITSRQHTVRRQLRGATIGHRLHGCGNDQDAIEEQ